MKLRQRESWIEWAAACGVAGFVASWLAGSGSFYRHDSDTLVPKLASTMEWSFYYWHSNRNGQLLPLLAMPFSHPLTNLVVQQMLGTFAGVMAIYLLVAFATGGRRWFVPGTAAVACFLAGATTFGHSLYLEGSHTFGTGMALVLGGLLLVRRATLRREDAPRLAAASLLVATGLWVNVMVVVFAAALVGIDGGLGRAGTGGDGEPMVDGILGQLPGVPAVVRRWVACTAVPMGLLAACLGVTMFVASLALVDPYDKVPMSFVEPSRYPGLVATVASKTGDMVVGSGGAMLILAATIAAAWLEGRSAWPRSVAVIAAAGFAFFMVVAGMKWVAMNGGNPRYVLPAIIAGYACVGTLLAATVREASADFGDEMFGGPEMTRRLRWSIVAAIPLSLLSAHGWPDPTAPRRAIAGLGSPHAERVVESGIGFVSGDYWTLWPVVFKANLILCDRGESRRVWGLGCRAGDTRHRWADSLRDGGATLVFLPPTSRHRGHDLPWIAEHLDIEIGDREGLVGDLEVHRVRLRDGRIARQ